MRQSAWLKRLDRDATRPETAQSSSRSGACSCHRTKQTIRNQMDQLPATRREMGPGICSFFRFSGFETDAAGSRCEWFHELTDGFEERMDMVIVRFDPPL